jgi:hypothetical protein
MRPLGDCMQVYSRGAVHAPIRSSPQDPAPLPTLRPLRRGAVPVQPVSNQHSMTTRGKSGIQFR